MCQPCKVSAQVFVFCIPILPLSTIFLLDFRNVLTMVFCSVFHCIRITNVNGRLNIITTKATVVKELRSKMFGQHPWYFKAVFLKQTRIIIVSIYKYCVYNVLNYDALWLLLLLISLYCNLTIFMIRKYLKGDKCWSIVWIFAMTANFSYFVQ